MNKDDKKIGLVYGIATFMMWGMFPVFFKLLNSVSAVEILAHRFLWSVFFVLIFLKIQGKTRNLKRYILNTKTFLTLTACGCFISINWGIYIYAVNSNQILEASLGYFINPLMFIILGAVFLKEKTSKIEKIAIFLVVCAIAIQIVNLGNLPIISIFLPLAFSIYGLIKKQIAIPALEGLFCETLVLAFVALCYISFLGISEVGSFGFNKLGFILIIAGLVTVLPLITFNLASKKLNFSTIGYLQYISPTLTTILAVFVYKEDINAAKILSFAIIWVGLFLIGVDSYLKGKKNV
ncbi:resistance permease RarD [Campylobacter blaseri]|uniref:Protein RarD n=1 Tax=Campylobacter blaseri TaxID=2042961 RepID=A0A2P8R2A7_9BACT|nr:EamA family transporter RarD [Campylobacter blaseri]PSM52627.1 protein RarD [Campylobacter blaseri]PSM54275.1 protein RarD [Campylobacter blaseri]QKF85926.1 resistance permease RarD [Campylobacter blaseri]